MARPDWHPIETTPGRSGACGAADARRSIGEKRHDDTGREDPHGNSCRRAAAEDAELAKQLGFVHQTVNQACRQLEVRVSRRKVGGRIVNVCGDATVIALETTGSPRAAASIAEDDVKRAIGKLLQSRRFAVTIAWGRSRGIDIEARRGAERWVIEAKGSAPPGAQQVNYFLGAPGELVQRMADDVARYGLALPEGPQYRGLVRRLPRVARRRLDLTVFFVRREGDAFAVDV
jgi:hypothetical protein